MVQKPMLMILGTHHLANPGRDIVNLEADDVLSPKRQREITQLLELLRAFQPTKIAVEVVPEKDAELEKQYQRYLAGDYELQRNEVDQLAFRLAKMLGHSKIYPVDWFGDPPVEDSAVDFEAFAKAHGQEALLEEAYAKAQARVAEEQEIQEKGSLLDLYVIQNQPARLRAGQALYFITARIGLDDQYPGAEWVQYWYGRNLKIFVNLTRITSSSDERILLIIGAGHVWLLQQFAEESGFYELESPLRYLVANSEQQ
jgi:hypothetical protein